MGKLSLFEFLAQPEQIARGLQRLGPKGAVLHAVRRAGAATDRALLGPAQLRINPMGVLCNHTCPMCWLQHLSPEELAVQRALDRKQHMSLQEYEALFAGMPAGLTEVNVVGGGEPLLHPEIVGILQAIKRRGLRGYLMTNGTCLKEDVARAMVAMRWDRTRISTHAGDRETYALVQGVDHLELLRRQLRFFDGLRRDAGVRESCRLAMHYVIQRENVDAIAPMFEFSADVGADEMVFELVFPNGPDKRLTRSELERAAEALGEGAARTSIPNNLETVLPLLLREQEIAPEQPLPPNGAAPAPPPEAAASPAEGAVGLQAVAPAGPGDVAEGGPEDAAPAPTPPHADPAQAPANQAHVEPVEEFYRPANRCSVGFDSAFITAKGDVLPCCFSDETMGNVRRTSFRDVWRGARYTDFRSRLINGRFADYCSRFRCKLTSFLHD